MTDRRRFAEAEVLDAARCVVNSYRAFGGYTLPLSINLRRLATAQAELDAAAYVEHRDALGGAELSDNAGWDRSVLFADPAIGKEEELPSAKAIKPSSESKPEVAAQQRSVA